MGSAFSPWWLRVLYRVPGLFVVCLDGNYHWRWHRLCACTSGTNGMGAFVRVADRWLPLAPDADRKWFPVGERWWKPRAASPGGEGGDNA